MALQIDQVELDCKHRLNQFSHCNNLLQVFSSVLQTTVKGVGVQPAASLQSQNETHLNSLQEMKLTQKFKFKFMVRTTERNTVLYSFWTFNLNHVFLSLAKYFNC